MDALFKAALSAGAIYIPSDRTDTTASAATPGALAFAAKMAEYGYLLDEKLYRAICHLTNEEIEAICVNIETDLKISLNWAPLIKNWTTPVNVSVLQELMTILANVRPEGAEIPGTRLRCGHIIPKGTFPLERYNGCPLCGTPFDTSADIFTGQGDKNEVLSLWNEKDVENYYRTLLASPTPLHSGQLDTVKGLVDVFDLPEDVDIKMHETAIAIASVLINKGEISNLQGLIKTPTDILRALWYEKTGLYRIISPKIAKERECRNIGYRWADDYEERLGACEADASAKLKLKYPRSVCRTIAKLLEGMPYSPDKMCEDMNPHRGMWVRFIRALRLTEFARRNDYPHLREILDRFYRQDYTVWAGQVEQAMLTKDTTQALRLLSQRPGAFARRLIATILRLGAQPTLLAFSKVSDLVDADMLITLINYSHYCLDPKIMHIIRLAGGSSKTIIANKLLFNYSTNTLSEIESGIRECCLEALRRRLSVGEGAGCKVYIAPRLFHMPYPIGERGISDNGSFYVPQGTDFDVKGKNIRLFLHWGEGLPAQNLDMDLSSIILYPDHREDCAFYNLAAVGATHSGDIQRIPDNVGTAEYIELDINTLRRAGAQWVVFVVNSYTPGALNCTVRIGWMDTAAPMEVSNDTGVAYDPSTVQFKADITGLTTYDAMIFGALDVVDSKIIWLEVPLNGQTAGQLDPNVAKALLAKLSHCLTIGEVLTLRAEALNQTIVDTPENADEIFEPEPTTTLKVAKLLQID